MAQGYQSIGKVAMAFLVVLGACMLAANPAWANVTFDSSTYSGMSAEQIQAFQLAQARWSAVLGDNVNVKLDVSMSSLTSPSQSEAQLIGSKSFKTIRDMMAANAGETNNAREAALLANLPTAAQFAASAILPAGWSVDGNMSLTLANYHALGGTGWETVSSGSIVMASNFTWDYNPGDGISAGAYDYVGMATQAIGHVLGFVSDVDAIDYFLPDAYTTMPTPLDMFRFAASDINSSFNFATTGRYMVPDTSSQVFYFGDGTAALSTGELNGDGFQAGNWKSGVGGNLMEPDVATGRMMQIGPQDLIAMDLIGWDVVPEPATLLLLAAGALVLIRRRRGVR